MRMSMRIMMRMVILLMRIVITHPMVCVTNTRLMPEIGNPGKQEAKHGETYAGVSFYRGFIF